jgi:phosphocarrier protein HPr
MSGQAVSKTVEIVNKRGLHARASAKFVTLAAQFDAQILVCREGMEVCASSIMGLMMLGAGIGEVVMISAQGTQAQEALDALCALVANRFDEDC